MINRRYHSIPTTTSCSFGRMQLLLACLIVSGSSAFSTDSAALKVVGLRCNGVVQPFGIEGPNYTLSWLLQPLPGIINQQQTAYQVQVSNNADDLQKGRAYLWDSKKVNSANSFSVKYRGSPIGSEKTCYWRVRVWDSHHQVSSWSAIHSWTTGLQQQDDWKGSWIKDTKETFQANSLRYEDDPAPYFKKQFRSAKEIRHAYLHIAGLGFNNVYVNGKKVGDRMLDPAWTTYSKRIYYSSYDVSREVRAGVNTLGVWLGNGWYNPLPLLMWGSLNLRQHLDIDDPAFILQLNIVYDDGTTSSIASDTSWLATDSHITRNNIYLGEKHDMRKANRLWSEESKDTNQWRKTDVSTGKKGPLQSQPIPPVRITENIPVKSIKKLAGNRYVIDFGKNFAGIVRLSAGGKAGETIRVKYGELLYDDGSVNPMTSVAGQIKRKGKDTAYRLDEMVLSGEQNDTLLLQFSYTGFRYIEVSNYPGVPDSSSVMGLRMNTDLERSGSFHCSDSLLNAIYQNSINTFLSNVHGLQTDCPHRERFGYGGDIAITAPSFILNFAMKSFYEKTLDDFSDAQRADGGFTETAPYVGISDEGLTPGAGPVGWGYVYPVLMDLLFRYYGDTSVLTRHYLPLKKWVDYLHANSKELIIYKCISDHESIDPKPVALTSTAFFYRSAFLLSRFASVLNKKEDARKYSSISQNIRKAFLNKFLDTTSGKFDRGTQASQAFALKYNLVPSAVEKRSVNILLDAVKAKDYHVATGMFGTLYMLEMLSEKGHHDAAWKIVQQRSFPGWGYMIERGATTIWEHWEFSDNTFSHNHPMWGSVTEWLIRHVAGINPAEEAINKIKIKPFGLEKLDSLKAEYNSIMGKIAIRWNTTSRAKLITVIIPPNTSAELHLPLSGSVKYRPEGVRAKAMQWYKNGNWQHVNLGSGEFTFQVPIVQEARHD